MYWVYIIARRYVFSKKSTHVINVITGITMIGIAAISFAFVVIMSIFNGFEGLVLSLFNTFNPDIKISACQGKVITLDDSQIAVIKNIPYIKAMSFTLEENVLLRNNDRQHIARMKGVDEHFIEVTQIDSAIIAGEYDIDERENIYYCVLGIGVEQIMGINVEQPFNELDMFIPRRNATGSTINPLDAFYVQTIYPKGSFAIQQDFDASYVIVPISLAKKMLDYTTEFTALEISVSQTKKSDAAVHLLNTILDKSIFKIQNREQQEEELFQIMQLERWLVFILLALVLIIASFNISSSLTMLVIEKQQDIRILLQMGAMPRNILWIFVYTGVLLAVISSSIGIALGVLICYIQQVYGFIKIPNSSTFVIDSYPVDVQIMDIILVLLLVISIAIVTSYLSARKASTIGLK